MCIMMDENQGGNMNQLFEPISVPENLQYNWGQESRTLIKNHKLTLVLHWIAFTMIGAILVLLGQTVLAMLDPDHSLHLLRWLFNFIQSVAGLTLCLAFFLVLTEYFYKIANGSEGGLSTWMESWAPLLKWEPAIIGRFVVRYKLLIIFFAIVTLIFFYVSIPRGGDENEVSDGGDLLVRIVPLFSLSFNYLIMVLISRHGNLSFLDLIAIRTGLPSSEASSLGYTLGKKALSKNPFLYFILQRYWYVIMFFGFLPIIIAVHPVLYAMTTLAMIIYLAYFTTLLASYRVLAYRSIFEGENGVKEPEKVPVTEPLIALY